MASENTLYVLNAVLLASKHNLFLHHSAREDSMVQVRKRNLSGDSFHKA